MKNLGKWIGGLIVVALLIGACSAAMSGGTRPAGNVGPLSAAPPAPAIVTAAVQPPVVSTPAGPATAMGDGTYEVGPDIVAGKYKTPGTGGSGVLDSCYWARMKDDSGDLGSIIDNDNFNGPGVVSVKKGELLKLSGGCAWSKQ